MAARPATTAHAPNDAVIVPSSASRAKEREPAGIRRL
jgi:hypothetical protein